jgi:outer membrane protein assembly factor BamA
VSIIVVGIFWASSDLKAQTPVPTEPSASLTDSTNIAFLPALAYDSDIGLILGGIGSRYKYQDNAKPFYSYLNASLIITTKGLISLFFEFDKPYIFDSDNRLNSKNFLSRFTGDQYYGIGNYDKLPGALVDSSGYYFYNSFTAGFDIMLRKPFLRTPNGSQLDVFGIAGFKYQTPWGNDSTQLIASDQPVGYDGAYLTRFGTGVVWEGRNNEFNPTKGFYFKAGLEAGGKLLGSSTNYLKLETEARSYISFNLIREITFANRLLFKNTAGTLPYWKLPELGGVKFLRGYPEYRFLDDNSILLNSELRTWLFELPSVKTRLGGNLFADIGRTFPNGSSFDRVFNDLKYTLGFGATASFFTADFIMRGDVGFSEEGYGIYFTAGYLF